MQKILIEDFPKKCKEENVEKSQNENKINNEAQQEKKEDINVEIKPPEINKIQPKIKENIITHTEGQKKNGFDYYSSGIILGKDDKKNTNVKIEGDVNAPKPNIENVDVNLNKSNPSQKVEIKDPNIEANINKKDNENIKVELKDEKLKYFRYTYRAKKIQNKAIINESEHEKMIKIRL